MGADHSFYVKTIETHARAFFKVIIFSIGSVNNFVNFELFFTKLSGIDPYEKRIKYPSAHSLRHVFMACSKLEKMPIYLVKQACGHDK